MEKDNRQTALGQLLEIVAVNGYVTFDDVIRCSDACSLSIGEFDWLSKTASSRNIIIYDEPPKMFRETNDDYDDFAQVDFEKTFDDVIQLSIELKPLINDIRNIMPPQRGEVARLKYQVKEGNQHARSRMIEMYLRLAIRIALQRSKSYDMDIEDAIGYAYIGLIIAVDKYDPDYSGPFVSFASLWIYQNLTREQCTKNPHIYFPVHRKEWYYSMYPPLKKRGCIECEKFSECDKVIDLICDKLECDKAQAQDVIMAALPSLSLDVINKQMRCIEYFFEHEGVFESYPEAASLVYSDDTLIEAVDSSVRADGIYKTLELLTERQKDVLIDRFGLKDGDIKTLDIVGQKYGLTRERIRQIEQKALRRFAFHYKGRKEPT